MIVVVAQAAAIEMLVEQTVDMPDPPANYMMSMNGFHNCVLRSPRSSKKEDASLASILSLKKGLKRMRVSRVSLALKRVYCIAPHDNR